MFADSLTKSLWPTSSVPEEYTSQLAHMVLDILKITPGTPHCCRFCNSTSYDWSTIRDHDKDSSMWLVLHTDGKMVGFARVYHGYIMMFGVVSEYRGRGVGRAIVEAAADVGYIHYKVRETDVSVLPFLSRVGCPATVWIRPAFDSEMVMYLDYVKLKP